MKRIMIIAILFSLITVSFAAAQQDTLFNGPLTVDGNISFTGVVTTYQSEPLFLLGGNWTALVNHTLILGSGLYATPFAKELAGGKFLFTYGGPIIGWSFFPEKLLHLSAEFLFGKGSAWYKGENNNTQTFYVLEPQGNLELNMSQNFHIGLGGGYRFAMGTPDGAVFTRTSLSGWFGELLFRFGDF